MEGEDLTLLEQTTHTRLRTTGYTLESSLKNLPRRLNLQNGSWLYYKALDIENTAFCLVVTHHPTVVSPKEHLYEQMASNSAYDKEKCTKNHRDWLFNSSTCFFVNLHVSSGWCLRTMGKEKTACFSDVRGAETRDELLRTFAWEVTSPLVACDVSPGETSVPQPQKSARLMT